MKKVDLSNIAQGPRQLMSKRQQVAVCSVGCQVLGYSAHSYRGPRDGRPPPAEAGTQHPVLSPSSSQEAAICLGIWNLTTLWQSFVSAKILSKHNDTLHSAEQTVST